MQSVNASPTIPFFQSHKFFMIALILVILAVIGSGAYIAFKATQVQPLPQAERILSQQTLAEQYGLGVNLIAVTFAGGMLDLRLKIIDGEKAKVLLDDPLNFPVLRADNGVVLRTSEDIARQEIKFENGSNLFILYPNAQNVFKPGDPVTIVFGDIQVEPIPAK